MDATGITVPLVHASGERVPFAEASFDIVLADYGAFYWADPYRTVPEAARVLRAGGLVAFTHESPILTITTHRDRDHSDQQLISDYFGLRTVIEPDGGVSFQLTYGEWIRLFADSGLVLEELIEPRPGPAATSTYRDTEDLSWSRRWPSECIWRLRKPTGSRKP
jgi:ubiquinone/menaquinone biosynthesis C-methylase UbiE